MSFVSGNELLEQLSKKVFLKTEIDIVYASYTNWERRFGILPRYWGRPIDYQKNASIVYGWPCRQFFMAKNQLSIDILSLITFLQENGLLKKIGGIKILLELTNQPSNVIYLEEYIRLVKEKFLRRSLIQLGYKIINAGYITNIPFEDLLNKMEIEIFNLTNQFKSQETISSAQLLNDMFSELKEKFLK